jgi:hypothetical protein
MGPHFANLKYPCLRYDRLASSLEQVGLHHREELGIIQPIVFSKIICDLHPNKEGIESFEILSESSRDFYLFAGPHFKFCTNC